MRQGLKLTVLAGSAEARLIAQECQALGARPRALVSEPPRGPNPMPVPCVLQDFSDLSVVTQVLQGSDAIVDASHGFDAVMTAQGHAAARALGVPFLSYTRPAWPVDGPSIIQVPDVATAIAQIEQGARVFSAAGWDSLPDCAGFAGDRLFLRQTTRHDRDAGYGFVTLSFGDPPFDEAQEAALFKDLCIHTLICRNLGGRASYPKVAAALSLDLKVILIARPALPSGVQSVRRVEDAVAWEAGL